MTGAEMVALDADSPRADLEERFRALVGTHRERAVRLAWRLVGGDQAAAEDVVQEAFVRAHRALPRFREEASLSTWLYRIVVRQAASHRRWRALREAWTPTIEADAPVTALETDPALRERIRRALDRLTRRQRQAFVLVHMEQFSVREAAEIQRMPVGTLKSHLHRALTGLRRELADLRQAEEGVQE